MVACTPSKPQNFLNAFDEIAILLENDAKDGKQYTAANQAAILEKIAKVYEDNEWEPGSDISAEFSESERMKMLNISSRISQAEVILYKDMREAAKDRFKNLNKQLDALK
tara:strand:- start:811 stop:1140 length:330 start_codon:yes stop_codon:yes gene_type:complete